MRRFLLTLVVAMALPASALAGIDGSSHDFEAQTWTDSVCEPCHTPHNANLAVTDAPLWNHTVTTATFTPYSGFDLQATVAAPGGVSLLCLSCHDGSVALDSFGTTPGNTATISGPALFGTDLNNDHPISFTFDNALATADGELFFPDTDTTTLGGTINADLMNGTNQVECSSCHDVHNTAVAAGTKLLRITDVGSALCLTCHDK